MQMAVHSVKEAVGQRKCEYYEELDCCERDELL